MRRGRKKAWKPPEGGPSPAAGNRERILAASLRLFTTQGFHHTPTAQISREAGVSTGTLFHYFPDKNTLIEELYLSIVRGVAEAVRARDDPSLPTRERLGECFRAYIAWGVAQPEQVTFLNQFNNSPSIGEDVKQEAHQEFQWLDDLSGGAIREGILRDLPAEFYFVMVPQILNGILALLRSGGTTLTPDEIVTQGLGLIFVSEEAPPRTVKKSRFTRAGEGAGPMRS